MAQPYPYVVLTVLTPFPCEERVIVTKNRGSGPFLGWGVAVFQKLQVLRHSNFGIALLKNGPPEPN
jgi:hypothetical protein